MTARLVALLGVLVVPLLVPTALASPPDCATITRDGATAYGPYLIPVPLKSNTYDAYAETNFMDGLQRETCLDEDGATVAPDRYVYRVGIDTGGQGICITRLGCI